MLIIEGTLFTKLSAVCLKQLTLCSHHPQKVGGKMEFHFKESLHTFSIDHGSSYSSNDGEEHISNCASQMHIFKGPIQVSRSLYRFGKVFQIEVVRCIIHSLGLKKSFNFVVPIVMIPDFHNLISESGTKTRQLSLCSNKRSL